MQEFITTLEAIEDMIKQGGTPFFRLYQKVGYNDYTPLADNLKHNDVTAESSFSFLSRIVEHYPAGKVFAVKLSTAASSNGEKVTGYIEFKRVAPLVNTPAQVNGLGSISDTFTGGMLDNMLGQIQNMSAVHMATMEPRIKLATLEAQLDFRERDLTRREKELKEQEKELKQREEDRIKPLEKGFGRALEKFFGTENTEKSTSLAGAESSKEVIPPTVEEQMIEDIANKINDSGLETTEIAVIGEVAQFIINTPSTAGEIHQFLKTITR